uniref:Uncharacterized protein n=1 Tax=Gopherus agassizii TaxID=38772 RepID=A0A452GRV1_9SAUR
VPPFARYLQGADCDGRSGQQSVSRLSPVPWIRRQPMGGPPKPRDQRTLRRLPACCPHGDRWQGPRETFPVSWPGF